MRSSLLLAVVVAMVAVLATVSPAQKTEMGSAGDRQLVHMAGTPDCFVMAPEQGDPSKEPSILKMKGDANCGVPWHWHPAAENIMMVSGTARSEVKGEKAVLLHPGNFLSIPPKHTMRFACLRECVLFVYTDGPFAMHYVDDGGNEISPEEALKKK